MQRIKDNKILLWIILAVFLICNVCFYFDCYLTYGQIVFMKSDEPILMVLGLSIIIVSVLVIFLVIKSVDTSYKLKETQELLCKLLEYFEEAEGNSVDLHRSTQLMVMNLSKKLGVGADETQC